MSIINFRNILHYIPPKLIDNSFKILNRFLGTNFGIKQWFLLYKLKENSSSNGFKYLIPPKSSFWADPHVIKFKDDYFVFFEDYNYQSRKGMISFLTLHSNGNVSKSEKVLELEYHLSYPFVFEHEDRFFMIPECSESGKIQLYESFDFPYKWEPVNILMDNVNAVDTTLFKYNSIWWLFTSFKNKKFNSSSSNINIYYSKNLLSNGWIPHPSNPILSLDKSLRSAGNFFQMNNRIFRPSQHSSDRYGQGIHINEVVRLDVKGFKEIKIKTLDSNNFKNILGLHTFSKCNDSLFLDGLKIRHQTPEIRYK